MRVGAAALTLVGAVGGRAGKDVFSLRVIHCGIVYFGGAFSEERFDRGHSPWGYFVAGHFVSLICGRSVTMASKQMAFSGGYYVKLKGSVFRLN